MLLSNPILLRLDDELWSRVEDYRAGRRPVVQRTKAVRDLIELGLKIEDNNEEPEN